MKNTKVTLVPLTADDREQFILDNQWAFKYEVADGFRLSRYRSVYHIGNSAKQTEYVKTSR